jgi:hypothetical protein
MNQSDLIFTRYLYVKEEVEITLLVSILNKSDDAIFWAYELYYSGFKYELFDFLLKIYYDFFATLNPTFEAYLLKKYKEFCSDTRLVSSIIQDLLFRPFNTDVFFLKSICSNFEIECDYHKDTEKITDSQSCQKNLIQWFETNDYRSIAEWILNVNKDTIDINDIYSQCLDIFELTNPKLVKEFIIVIKFTTNMKTINKNIVLLSKIMSLFSKKHNLKKGKSIYINVEPEDIITYETIYNVTHYRILETACICGINDFKHLSLFKLKRNKYNLNEIYWYKWLYYASFSPLWLQRISQFGGTIDYLNQTVLFDDEDLMEEFYSLYGLEPDEQKECVQNKSIVTIEKINNWLWFYNNYKKNGFVEIWEEELEEFDVDGLQYSENVVY